MRKLLAVNSPIEIKKKSLAGHINIPKIMFEDFELAIKNTRPSVAAESIARFESWNREFGSK